MQGFNMGRYHAPSTLDTSLAPPTKRTKLAASISSTCNSKSKSPPTIRFEMPFAIWCSTCPSSSISTLIGQGVRFNALKTRVGNYHSTAVWAFRMKHTACGGWIEIRTDPANSEFVVTEGARRREQGSDEAVAERIGGVLVGVGEAEKERRRTDAFAALEGVKEEKEVLKGEARRVEEIRSRQERDWRDPDEKNRRLRAEFRPGRKSREVDRERMEVLRDRMGLGIEVLEETEGDRRRARLVEFGRFGEEDGVIARSMFESSGKSKENASVGGPKVDALRKELSGNTRAALDPFSMVRSVDGPRTTHLKAEIKGKRTGLMEDRPKDLPQSAAYSEMSEDLTPPLQHERKLRYNGALLDGEGAEPTIVEAHQLMDVEKVKDAKALVDYESD